MASVTFSPSVGGDGSTVTDDNNATTGLGNGGHRTRFVPALSQIVAVAANTVTQTTNAATSASQALTYRNEAQAAATSAAENAVLGKYVFSSTIAMADPGVGVFRLNNATLSSVTAVAVDAQTSDSGNPNILNYLLTWDDSTSAVKGQLRVAKAASPTTFVIFDVTGLVDNTGWVQLTVSHVASSGTFTNNDVSYFEFFRTGDAGTGDVSLNGTQTLNNKSLVDSTTFIVDNTDSTKKVQFEVSVVTTGTTRTVTIPDENLTLAGRGANTFTGNQTGSDNQLIQWMLKDVGGVYLDKGTVSSGTVTFNYTDGPHQRLQVGGALTIAANTWPPSGNNGILLIELVNGASATITWPTVNWIKSDGTTTTVFSNNGVTLQTSGTDWVILWTRDGGTTVYGKIVR